MSVTETFDRHKTFDIVVQAKDELLHEPGEDFWWSESYMTNAVSDDASIGIWMRLGRYVNQDRAVIHVGIAEKGKPTILLSDVKAPLPPPDSFDQTIKTAEYAVSFKLQKELEAMRVTFEGTIPEYEDSTSPLREEKGTPVKVKYDLMVKVEGSPYHYKQAARYETPTRTTGTIQIGDRKIDFAGYGQRDHSFAPRDWWLFDWLWFDLHLEDGTHLHASHLPVHGFGDGYIQKDGKVTSIEKVTSNYTRQDNGLITSPTIKIEPGGIELTVEPQAYSPVLFKATDYKEGDDRIAEFTRLVSKVTAKDGRKGYGFTEYHQLRTGLPASIATA